MCRRPVASLFLLFVSLSLLAQRRTLPSAPSLPPTSCNLTIRILYENDLRPTDMQERVQLLNSGGVPIGETFTDSSGQAHFGPLTGGSYTVRVTGLDIAESTSRFDILPRESMHYESVFVRLKPPGVTPTSKQGTISAASLKVPEKAARELERGNQELRKHNPEAARKHYQKALEIYPQFSSALNNLGVLCMEEKDYACSRDSFEKAVAADPDNAHALINLARIRMLERAVPAAQALLEKALVIDPLDPQALTLMAENSLNAGHYDDAVAYAHKVHTVPHERFAVAHLIAGEALELQRKPQEAAVEYETFLKEAPQDPAAATARAGLERVQSTSAAAAPPRP